MTQINEFDEYVIKVIDRCVAAFAQAAKNNDVKVTIKPTSPREYVLIRHFIQECFRDQTLADCVDWERTTLAAFLSERLEVNIEFKNGSVLTIPVWTHSAPDINDDALNGRR